MQSSTHQAPQTRVLARQIATLTVASRVRQLAPTEVAQLYRLHEQLRAAAH